MKHFKRDVALFVLAFVAFCLPSVAKDINDEKKDDYEWLARVGTLEDVQDAYEKNKKAFTRDFYGENRETFLMLVLKNNREYPIIKFCLDVDTKVKDRVAKGGRTTLMYAARYCTDENVISLILKNSSLFAKNRSSHVLQQDNKGYDAFAYSRNNPNFKVYMELYKYAPDSGITMLPKDDPSYLKPRASAYWDEDAEVSTTSSITPPPASPSESVSSPPPSSTAGTGMPPPAKSDDTQEEIPPEQRYLR